MRKTHNLVQGSKEWHALRATALGTASEAAAMMGVDPKTSRDELLSMKKFGYEKEISEYVKRFVFTKGHETEAAARPIIERMIGEELYPETITNVIDGMLLLASLDGKSLLDEINFEHKQWNEKLAEVVRNKDLDPYHYWQLEQQLVVGEIEKAIFVVSDGTEEKMEWMYYESVPERRKALIAGWRQFRDDYDTHEHVVEVISPVAKPTTELPSVVVNVSGSIDIIDNFKVFEVALRDFIDNKLILSPQTDQDFADLDSQIKSLKKAESALDIAEANMLSQISTVDSMKRTKEMLHKMARDNRLAAERISKAKKISRRTEILEQGRQALSEFIETLKASIDGDYLPEITADFAGAMKGKGKISSLISAANDELARTKIHANEIADQIRKNLIALKNAGGNNYPFLFNDMREIIRKQTDDLVLLVQSRISEHKATEERKLEAERERIRAEEKAKAEREVQAKAEQAERERQEEIRAKAKAEADKLAAEQAERDRIIVAEAKERGRKEAEEAEEDRKRRAEEDARKHREAVRITPTPSQDVIECQQKAAKGVFPEKPLVTEGQITQSLIENGIGKVIAKKVAILLVAGKIEGVILN